MKQVLNRGTNRFTSLLNHCLLVAAIVLSGPAYARFDVVVDHGEPAPDGNGTFSSAIEFITLNNNGFIAMLASYANTAGGSSDSFGLLITDGNTSTIAARKGQTTPDGQSIFDSRGYFLPPNGITFLMGDSNLNDNLQLAFYAIQNDNQTAGDQGNYIYNNGVIHAPFVEGDPAPDGNGTLASGIGFFPTIGPGGSFAINAGLTGTAGGTTDDKAIYLAKSDGSITTIARKGDITPDGSFLITDLFTRGSTNSIENNSGPNIHNQIALSANVTDIATNTTSMEVLYYGDGNSLTQIAKTGDSANNNGIFSNFLNHAINDSADAMFEADLSGTTGGTTDDHAIFYKQNSGTLKEVIREGQSTPNGNGQFSSFFAKKLTNAGSVFINADLAGTNNGQGDDTGIYRWDSNGTMTKLLQEGDSVPDGNGKFSSPNLTRYSDGNFIGFEGDVVDSSGTKLYSGIFLTDGVDTVTALKEGDVINSQLTVNSYMRFDINDHGQVALTTGGLLHVVRFTPDLSWRMVGSGQWDDNANWTLGIAPANPHETTIRSAGGATIDGPTQATNLKKLTIDALAGTDTLVLNAAGVITTQDGITLGPYGRLAGNGTVFSDVFNSGEIDASQTGNPLTINGDLFSTTTGKIVIDIAGAGALTEFDQLLATGAVLLDGELNVKLSNTNIALGDSFDLITAETISGGFASLVLGNPGNGLAFMVQVLADQIGSQDVVRLTAVTAVPLPATFYLMLGGIALLLRTSRR